MAPGIDDSTAPIADECQSFLDNVVAQFARRDRRIIDRARYVRTKFSKSFAPLVAMTVKPKKTDIR